MTRHCVQRLDHPCNTRLAGSLLFTDRYALGGENERDLSSNLLQFVDLDKYRVLVGNLKIECA